MSAEFRLRKRVVRTNHMIIYDLIQYGKNDRQREA